MDLERQSVEVLRFLEACPQRPTCQTDTVSVLLAAVPALQALLQGHPSLCRRAHRDALERCLFDMVEDGQGVETFVEFGLWAIDQCAAQGVEGFFAQIGASRLEAFVTQELFRYSVLRKRHHTTLLPNATRGWCEWEWCGHEGHLGCSRCLRSAQRRVLYCSRACQLKHWSTHRRTCGMTEEEIEQRAMQEDVWDLKEAPSLSDTDVESSVESCNP